MREAFNIIGKIVSGTATEDDRRRLDHLNWLKAKSMKRPRSSRQPRRSA